MVQILCVFWALLLGLGLASLGCFLWRLIRSKRLGDEEPSTDTQARSALPILYLTPVCIAALGRCAHPAKLRRMSSQCIGRLLERFPFPQGEARPTEERYSSWPEQARLLCAGNTEALHALQQTLIAALGNPAEPRQASKPSASSTSQGSVHASGFDRGAWLPAFLAVPLLLAALIAWWEASQSTACRCAESVMPPGGGNASGDLSTDLIFDFDRSTPRSPAHEAKLLADLHNLFREFDGIKIRAVVAYTDPIGSTEENRDLARRRAATIRTLIEKIVRELPAQFAIDPLPPDQASLDEPSRREDAAFWQACFSRYFSDLAPADRPLVDLPEAKNSDNRVPCSRASATDIYPYPACARLPIPTSNQNLPLGYAQRAEDLRELIECLAPMRRVLIQFSYDRRLPKADKRTPTSTIGAEK